MTLIAAPGSVPREQVARPVRIETRQHHGREYQLVRVPAGWEPAGSMMRWTDGYHAVWFYVGGARNGRRFTTEADARATLDAWTTDDPDAA